MAVGIHEYFWRLPIWHRLRQMVRTAADFIVGLSRQRMPHTSRSCLCGTTRELRDGIWVDGFDSQMFKKARLGHPLLEQYRGEQELVWVPIRLGGLPYSFLG